MSDVSPTASADTASPAPGDPSRRPSPSEPRLAPGLEETFRRLSAEGRTALVAYITCGFPDAAATPGALDALAEAGADVIELGIPFSDPLADGPVIQASSFRALEGGMTVTGTLDILRGFRARHATPVVIFTYLNPVLSYGLERFAVDAAEAGAQGILLTDLPAGADPEMESALSRAGLDVVRLLAPTTPVHRIGEVATGGRGFVYYISRTGVTGTRESLREGLLDEVTRLRKDVSLPIAVGFGISTAEQAREVAAVADGIVVGSALVRALEEGGIPGLRALTAELRAGIDGALTPRP